MAKYTTQRLLGRKSSHRRALLRNLVTSLFEHESISTTWPKAKEAQRLAEKLVTFAKKNTNASRLRAQQYLFVCSPHLPSLLLPSSLLQPIVTTHSPQLTHTTRNQTR